MTLHSKTAVLDVALSQGVVPLFDSADAEAAISLVEATYRGGLRIIEFTNRSPGALEVFAALAAAAPARYPDMMLGAGTVLDPSQAEQFVEAGASFIVSPFLDENTGRWCSEHDLFWGPGVGTVTEAMKAHNMGASIVKLFPAEVLGPGFIRAVKPPCPWLRMMPSGGVTLDRQNLASWFDAGAACVAVGSALFKSASGMLTLSEVEERTASLLSTVSSIRSASDR